MKQCFWCKNSFEISAEDRDFYQKIAVAEPTLCSSCREQRRLAFRNERNLYRRNSALSGQPLLSYLSSDKPYKIYSQEEWWSDKWDALDYGRDFDFSKPFFEQFKELLLSVPRMNILLWQSENCDYCNFVDFCRDCYLLFAASNCQDCYYSNLLDSCRDCMDSTSLKKSELCYDCVDCVGCNNLAASIRCENSHDLAFCFDCRSCEDCFGCFNLTHKKYHIFNQPYSAEEYLKKRKELVYGKSMDYLRFKSGFLERCRNQAIHKAVNNINCENCLGDNLSNSKNARECFESNNLNDCAYAQFSMNSSDAYDIFGSSNKGCEVAYEAVCLEGKNIISGFYIAGYNDIYYSDFVAFCSNVFGCAGLRHKEFCILNKQYSREEYFAILAKIIEHMKKTGEWGEFFPVNLSPFAYNETVAQEVFPMKKEQILAKGWAWKDPENKDLAKQSLPVDKQVLLCGRCGKNYKLIEKELAFYKKMRLPLPQVCHNCRHGERSALRNPRKLSPKQCLSCGSRIKTSCSPQGKEKVYCEKCYRKML